MKEHEQVKSTTATYINKSLSSTIVYLLSSLLTKFLNITFTILIIRVVSKESFSLSKVYFDFIFTLIHFIPRETIRKACQKYAADSNPELEKAKLYECCQVNLVITLSVAGLSVPLFFMFIYAAPVLQSVYIHLVLYIIGALVEMLMEPVILVMNLNLDDKFKLLVTKSANYSKLLFNYLLPLFFGLDLWAFTLSRSIGCLFFILTSACLAIFKYSLPLRYFLPNLTAIKEVTPELKALMRSFLRITMVKAFLNFTEKFSLNFFLGQSEEHKGEYTFVMENCGMITKYLMEPLEENFYNLISKLKTVNQFSPLSQAEVEDERILDGNAKCDLDYLKDRQVNSKKMLKVMIKFVIVFSMMFLGFMYFAGRDLLETFFTSKWSTRMVIEVGFFYSVYICLLALANTVDTYANAVSDQAKLQSYSRFLLVAGVIQFGLSVTIPRFYLPLLILATSTNILFKFCYASYLIFSIPKEEDIARGIASSKGYFSFKSVINNCFEFYAKSSVKVITFLSIMLCMNLIELLSEKGKHEKNLLLSLLVLVVNIGLVYTFEKKHFQELFSIS